MGMINIDIEVLNTVIGNLQGLQSGWTAEENSLPSKIGGGGIIDELDLIAEAYNNLNADICTLLTNTIAFLRNVNASFVTADSKAVEMFEK